MTTSVFVTGGASGIGAATARRIVRGGYVAIVDLNLTAAQTLATELGPRAVAFKADTTCEDEVRAAHAGASVQLPALTGLVNSAAAMPAPTAIEALEPGEFDRVLHSHVTGTFVPCRVVGSAMADRGNGAIVNLASVLAFRAGPVLAYGAGKAGVVSLTEALAVHWAKKRACASTPSHPAGPRRHSSTSDAMRSTASGRRLPWADCCSRKRSRKSSISCFCPPRPG
jgi:NAD(P)-dependent dehydrogenase (short-subunit alcohol dehydrogenase family)